MFLFERCSSRVRAVAAWFVELPCWRASHSDERRMQYGAPTCMPWQHRELQCGEFLS